MTGMIWFTIGVGTVLGCGAAVYIWAVNHFRH
jgi:hypothetical protein